jgi:tellurite resistance-related uncharacterized protein
MKKMLLLLCLASSIYASAQMVEEFGPGGGSRLGSLIVYNSQELNNRVAYEHIKGIPYWRNDYLPAMLYAPGNKLYGTFMAKVNLATREVEYINKNKQELAAYPDELVRAVFVDPNDTTKIISIFRNDLAEVNLQFIKRNRRYYVQELNQGPVKLLKVCDREIRVGDSMFRTMKSYYFVDDIEYFIQHENRIEKLKKLNREEVMKFLPQPPAIEAWIKDSRISFTKEEDVLRLLEYYNLTTVKVKNE